MRIIAALLLLVACLPARAGAVTPDELVRLRQAGMGDEVLLALVDATAVQGRIDADEAIALKQAGLSDRVIAAAIRRVAQDDALTAHAEQAPGELPSSEAATEMQPAAPAVTGVYFVPQVVIVPGFVVPVGRALPRSRQLQPTMVDPNGFGRFINTYFHPLNDGVAIRSDAQDATAPHPRR